MPKSKLESETTKDRVERITNAVMFNEAARAYVDALLGNLQSLEIAGIRDLMYLRERCQTLRLMELDADPEPIEYDEQL